MFQNKMPRYEILSEDALEVLDKGWKRLVSEIGVEFLSDRALDLFRAAGQKVEDNNVFFDPDFLLEQVAKAPREFDVQARNPAHTVHIGGDSMAFGGVYGPPFVREGDVRRDATMDDFRNFTRLAQSFDAMDSAGGVICEPNDAPLDSRHLDMVYALQTLTDKIYMGNVVSGVNARDTIAMSSILFGGRDKIEQTPASDLADQLQLAAALGRPDAGRPVRVLRGAPAGRDHAVPADGCHVAGLDPGHARPADGRGDDRYRSLAADLARDAGDLRLVPVQHRHAVRLAAVRHAGVGDRPALHRPDRPSLRAAGAVRRWLTSSQMPDAQAAYEGLMTMLPTFLAGINWVMHTAGWLDGGLVASYEKFVIDVQVLEMLQTEFKPLEITEESLAFGAHEEVGHGGHFLGAAHTMERFRTCFYRPFLSSSDNYERWMRGGARTPRPGPARSWPSGWLTTSSRRWTRRSAPSSRTTSTGAGPSSATELAGPLARWLVRRIMSRHEQRSGGAEAAAGPTGPAPSSRWTAR